MLRWDSEKPTPLVSGTSFFQSASFSWSSCLKSMLKALFHTALHWNSLLQWSPDSDFTCMEVPNCWREFLQLWAWSSVPVPPPLTPNEPITFEFSLTQVCRTWAESSQIVYQSIAWMMSSSVCPWSPQKDCPYDLHFCWCYNPPHCHQEAPLKLFLHHSRVILVCVSKFSHIAPTNHTVGFTRAAALILEAYFLVVPFLIFVTKYLSRSNLGMGDFLFIHDLRGYSPSWCGRHGGGW